MFYRNCTLVAKSTLGSHPIFDFQWNAKVHNHYACPLLGKFPGIQRLHSKGSQESELVRHASLAAAKNTEVQEITSSMHVKSRVLGQESFVDTISTLFSFFLKSGTVSKLLAKSVGAAETEIFSRPSLRSVCSRLHQVVQKRFHFLS